MTAFGIPVMFDVEGAALRADAAGTVATLIESVNAHLIYAGDAPRTHITSWWLIEAEDKHADGNDNAAGRVVFDDTTYPCCPYDDESPCPQADTGGHDLPCNGPHCRAQEAARALAVLHPGEQVSLTLARAQVARGEYPMPNIAAVCVSALARLTGQPIPGFDLMAPEHEVNQP